MEYLFIYCLQLFDRINVFYFTLIICTIVITVVYLFGNCMYLSDLKYTQDLKPFINFLKKIAICCISLTVIFTFIPTKNTLLLIGGMYLGKKTINTVITSEKIKKVDTIINLELDKRIKELKEGRN